MIYRIRWGVSIYLEVLARGDVLDGFILFAPVVRLLMRSRTVENPFLAIKLGDVGRIANDNE